MMQTPRNLKIGLLAATALAFGLAGPTLAETPPQPAPPR